MFVNNYYPMPPMPIMANLGVNLFANGFPMKPEFLQPPTQLNPAPMTPNLLDHTLAFPNIWMSFQNLCRQYQENYCKKFLPPNCMLPEDLSPQHLQQQQSPLGSPILQSSCYNSSSSSGRSSVSSFHHKIVDDEKPCDLSMHSSPAKSELSERSPVLEPQTKQHKYSCQQCSKFYVSLSALKMHVRTHTLPCKCQICGKAFSRMWLLTGHLRTHTGEKPFSCNQCDRAFADRSNLRAHQQTHSQVKKYRCNLCQRTFSRMGLLNKHSSSCCGLSVSSSSTITH